MSCHVAFGDSDSSTAVRQLTTVRQLVVLLELVVIVIVAGGLRLLSLSVSPLFLSRCFWVGLISDGILRAVGIRSCRGGLSLSLLCPLEKKSKSVLCSCPMRSPGRCSGKG